MSAFTPTRSGQVNGAGDDTALFLKVFGGEVLTAFAETNVAMSRHQVRTISSGKSAQFPATWKGTAATHTPGAELTGSTVLGNERVITINDLLVADRFIADIDEAMNHWDYRAPISRDIGMALSRTFDENVLINIGLAARAAATVTGGNGGTAITSATSGTDADALIAAAFDAAQAFDEKDVPEHDRYFAVSPALYYLLVNSSSKLINRDYGNDGNGSIAGGFVMRVAGMEIVKSNNLPNSNIVTGDYLGDFSTTTALAWQKAAVGTVKLIDLSMQLEYSVRHQGTLLVGRYAVGHGILRPECAVEIKTA